VIALAALLTYALIFYWPDGAGDIRQDHCRRSAVLADHG